MDIDETKIEAKRLSLGVTWIAVDGYNAVTSIEIQGPVMNFIPSKGIPLKVFVNTETGEMRLFPLIIFTKDGV